MLQARPGPFTSDYDYDLPQHLIAQEPREDRDGSRLLVLDRGDSSIQHSTIRQLPGWLNPGDLVVVNNSLVIPARLRGVRAATGGAVEILLLRASGGLWRALGKPAKRLRRGDRLEFPSRSGALPPAVARVERNLGDGQIAIRFEDAADDRLEAYGEAPLPPYITSPLTDAGRYQTVFAKIPGSAAAPTAGLHFTESLFASLAERGVTVAEVTLHVGLDTFRPVSESLIQTHKIHREWCSVSPETVAAIKSCHRRGGRVVAIGTTAARTLETLGRYSLDKCAAGFSRWTDLFITPGYHWHVVDALLTNFHLPRSTLLMLVSAFAGRELVLGAYHEAMRLQYRFYSFGDAMLIL